MGPVRRGQKRRPIYGEANQEYRKAPIVIEDDEGWDVKERSEPRLRRPFQAGAPDNLPSLSISRPVNLRTEESASWLAFIDDLKQRNSHKGTVTDIGDLACFFVTADSLKAMFIARYPHAYNFTERNRARRLQRDFAHCFNRDFVRGKKEAAHKTALAQQVGSSCLQHGMVTIGDELLLAHPVEPQISEFDLWEAEEEFERRREMAETNVNIVWGAGMFPVRSIETYGPNGLGVDLRGDERLDTEWHEIRDYLHQEGFDLNLLTFPVGTRHLLEPRVKIFEAYSTGRLSLTYTVERPEVIPLHSPVAREAY